MTRVLRRVFAHPLALGLGLLSLGVVLGVVGWQRWEVEQLLRQGEAALAAREYDKARQALARYLAVRPEDAAARLLAARAARRVREYYEASEHLRYCRKDRHLAEAVAIETKLSDVQRGKDAPVAELRRRAQQDDDLAIVILEVLIQRDLDGYRLRDALHGLSHYIERRPDDLQALLGRGAVWESFLFFADALEDYRRAVAAHPNSERARLKLADTLLINGTPAEALEQYRWLADRWSNRPEVRFGLAKCHRRLGQTAEAQRLLDELLAEGVADGEVLWERGQLVMDNDSAAKAEPWLRRAVEAGPHDRRFNYALYRCLLAQGRTAEAEPFNARVARIDDDLRRLDQVRRDLLKRPEDASLFCEGGQIFLRNGDLAEGARWLRVALRLDPTCEAARKALAEAETRPAMP